MSGCLNHSSLTLSLVSDSLLRLYVNLIAYPEHLHLLLLVHHSLVQFQVDLVREHVQTSVRENLTRHLTRIDQVIDIVTLDVIETILHVEEGEYVEKQRDCLAASLT